MPPLQPPERFKRIVKPGIDGRARIGPRQIYILPTGYGLVFAVLLGLMLVGAINYTNNLGFLLTFLLCGLGGVAMLHTWRNLVGLVFNAGKVEPVFAGDDVCFEINATNEGRRARAAIRLELPDEGSDITDLDNRAATLSISKKSERRGELKLGRLVVSSHYPLGLFRAWSYLELDYSCLVFPNPGPRMPTYDLPDYTQSQQGDRGVGVDDYVGLRQYRSSDSPKHINWKAWSREQGLQTKQFGGDRSERRWLDWDAMPDLDVESRISRLCRGVLDACHLQHEFGLRLPGCEIKPGRGQHQRYLCLEALARFGETG